MNSMIRLVLILLILVNMNLHSQSLGKVDRFVISSSRDTVLFTEFGTKISMGGNSYISSTDSSLIEGTIVIHVKEIIDQTDMILNSVSTNYRDDYLISGGMIRIVAYDQSETDSLIVGSGSDIQIAIPSSVIDSEMEMYSFDELSGTWNRESQELSIDTCLNYRLSVQEEYKTVKKKEYKKWVEENYPGREGVGIFGGSAINISFGPKVYQIPISADTTYICDNGELSYYEFIVNSTKWFNVDKLSNPIRPVYTIIESDDDLELLLLVKSENCSLKPIKNKNNRYTFPKISSGADCLVFGYRKRENGEFDVVIKSTTAGSRIKLEPSKSVSIGEFKRILRRVESYYTN